MIGVPITSLGHLAHALYPLPVLAVLMWSLGRRSAASAQWNTRVDLGLAALCGLLVAGLSTMWMPRYFLLMAPLSASDFSQYCESIGAFRAGDLDGWVKQRSLVAGALPAWLAGRIGVIDGLFVAAISSTAALGSGVFLWARAVHSRQAGLMAALIACVVAPLVLLSRTTTFYPEAVASYVLCAAGVSLALRYRRLPAVFAGALGLGLVLLIDVRGLIWALPAFGLLCAACVAAPGWLRRLGGLTIVGVVLWASYQVGGQTSWDQTPSLEVQASYYVDEALRRAEPDNAKAGISHKDAVFPVRYVWGRSPIQDIPKTLSFLAELNALLPADIGDLPETQYFRRVHVMPFLWPALLCLGLALWGIRRRPFLLLGFLGGLLPFAIALRSASMTVAHVRYIATGVAMVPVILGVGFAVLAVGSLSKKDELRLQPVLDRGDVLGLGLAVLLILGVVPSWLSPASTWRAPVAADAEPSNAIWYASQDNVPSDVSPECAASLSEDYAAGYPVGSQLLDWTVKQAPSHRPR